MKVEFVRLLQIQRDLYELPRGRERFEAYLRTMIDARTGDLALPLVPTNPMGREHVPALLDGYIASAADERAEAAVPAASGRYDEVVTTFRAGLVIADDLKGGVDQSLRGRIRPSFRDTGFSQTRLAAWHLVDERGAPRRACGRGGAHGGASRRLHRAAWAGAHARTDGRAGGVRRRGGRMHDSCA
jgi:hypothetical protein